MEILKAAVAGTLESSDCMVTIEPAKSGLQLELESAVMQQYGRRIAEVAMETLDRLNVQNARVSIVDKVLLTARSRQELNVQQCALPDMKAE